MKKEIELKYLLESRSDFVRFAYFLKPYMIGQKTSCKQENYYFDTPAFQLRKSGLSLRLRKEDKKYLLSAKQSLLKRRAKEFLAVRLEYQGAVNSILARLMKNEFLSPIDVFFTLPASTSDDLITKTCLYHSMDKAAKMGLQMIGSFANFRTKIPISLSGQELEIELDHSRYPKSTEIYEVEVEFPSEKQAKALFVPLERLFKEAGIKTFKSPSKSSRLYKLLYG